MTWQDVQSLRKAGRFKDAIELGLHKLDNDPNDFKLRTQLDWAFYGLVKDLVGRLVAMSKASQPVSRAVVEEMLHELYRFAKQPKRRPDNALSNIVREVSKIASHFYEYAKFVRWVGLDGLAPEDWQYQHWEDSTTPPIAMNVARAMARWAKAHADASHDDIVLALEWNLRIRPLVHGDDALWLDWDKVLLLRRLDRLVEAAKALVTVIKAKRNEFWVWAEAARIYIEDQPDMALACACRALECGSDPQYTVRVHRELAEMLAERGEFAQASREVAIAVDIRQEHGWSIDSPLQKLINSSWYDPSTPSPVEPKSYYASHSQHALVLCFDKVEAKSATYLGSITPYMGKDAPPGRKVRPLPRFAIRTDDGQAVSIVGPGLRKLRHAVGDPVTVVIGQQDDDNREAIVQIAPRPEGTPWDCTDNGSGVVIREASDGKRAKLYIGRDDEDIGMDAIAWLGLEPASLGQGVRFRLTRNRKTGKKDVFAVEPGPMPTEDVRLLHGPLRRNPKGFAFIEDAFISPQLVGQLDPGVDEAVALAVYGKHPKKPEYSLRVVKISAVDPEDSSQSHPQ